MMSQQESDPNYLEKHIVAEQTKQVPKSKFRYLWPPVDEMWQDETKQ